MMANQLPYWLAAMYLPGIGPRRVLRWLEQWQDIEKLFLAPSEQLHAMGLNAKQIAAIKSPNWKLIERDMAWAEQADQHLLAFDDVGYPALLKEIPDPPLVLFVRGNKAALQMLQVAIVGSRNATAIGLQNAEQFAAHLAAAGLAITSGLALGVDGASHRGALNAGGVTIGVAGTGLNQLYPAANRHLAAEICAKNGAVISELPLPTAPMAMNFPRRNRIISGLSVGVLVVEAALKSGSMITVKHALQQNREVFAIPGSIHHPLSRGCHHLIRQGAKLVETANDILEELGTFRPLAALPQRPAQLPLELNLTPDDRKIFEQIRPELTTMDEIILQSGLTFGEVSSILLNLELSGHIRSVMGGYVKVQLTTL